MLNSCFKRNKNVIHELDHKILQRILYKSNVENGTEYKCKFVLQKDFNYMCPLTDAKMSFKE